MERVQRLLLALGLSVLASFAPIPANARAAACAPAFGIVFAPAYGSTADLLGSSACLDPAEFHVAVYIYVGGWWSKPAAGAALTTIHEDGTWITDITTGGIDEQATQIVAFLLPVTYDPPVVLGNAALPAVLFGESIAHQFVTREARAREIEFAGMTWQVKSSDLGAVGPGPNYFSDAEQDIWVDSAGRLHLTLHYDGKHWKATEIISKESLGYGMYRFEVGAGVEHLDPNVVMGLFTWDTGAPEYNYREIDVELSRWNENTPLNAQYVVQPWDKQGNRHRFHLVGDGRSTVHAFEWRRDQVNFASEDADGAQLEAWTYAGADTPPSGGENVRMNLWLIDGLPPHDNKPVEVVVESFTFVPFEP